MKDTAFLAEELFAAFKSGDENAFLNLLSKGLYERFYLRAETYLQSNLSSKDVVNKVLLKVWNSRRDFNTLQELLNYIYAAIRNECFSHKRSLKVYNKHIQKAGELFEEKQKETGSGVDPEELRAMIEDPNVKLTRPSRDVLILFTLEGLSINEIAAELNMNPNNVRVTKFRALETLKLFFKKAKPSFFWLLHFIAVFI